MGEDYQDIDHLERDVTAHVHAQLGDYSRTHYTVNYEDFTAECVAEFLDEIQLAPLIDPTALKLPEDPMKALFRVKDIDALPPYEEPDRTNPEAISLLKAVQAQTRRVAPGRLKSERVAAELNFLIPEPHLTPDFMLTAQASRHNRLIGKGGYKKNVPTSLKSAHIASALTHIEDVVDPALPVDQLLKIGWDVQGVRATLNDLIKIHKAAPKFDDQHYLDKFSQQRVDLPDLEFAVMFPRCRQPGYRPEAAEMGVEPVNFEGLATVLPTVEQSLAPSSDDLPVQNMRLVDGWQTVCSSPPSSPDSPGVSDDDAVDQLCLASTPNTDPPTVDDLLRPKLEIPLFPRSRRRGGKSGVKPKLLTDETIATFLPSHIPCEAGRKGEANPSEVYSPIPATSLLGHASAVDVNFSKPNPDDDLDVELEHICKDVTDPFATIMEETIDDKFVPLMEVPTLPDPTERKWESAWVPQALKDLVTLNASCDDTPTQPYVKKAPAKQSITLALSWALCEVSEKPPPLIQILDVESPLDSRDSGNNAVVLAQVEDLLSRCSISEASEPTSTPSAASKCRQVEALTAQMPLPKDPLKQPTLLLSRLDRQRSKGKRKFSDDSEEELGDGAVLEEYGRRRTSQSSQGAPKRVRTEEQVNGVVHLDLDYGEDRSKLVEQNVDDGNAEQHHDLQVQDAPVHLGIQSFQDLGDMMAPRQHTSEEEDKENWDPSSGCGSDVLLDEKQGHQFDGGMVVEQDTGYMFAHHALEEELVSDLRVPLDEQEFDRFAEAAFEPLVMDTEHWDDHGHWTGSPQMVPDRALLPSPLASSKEINIDVPPRIQQQAASSSPSFPKVDPLRAKGLFSHSLGLFEFARLRSVTLCQPPNQGDHDIPLQRQECSVAQECRPPQDSPAKDVLPPDIVDSSTITIEEVNSRMASPNTFHRYLASLDILQKRALVRSLRSSDCFIDLVERTSLGGAHIIVDPTTAILFIPLLTLGAECATWIERVSVQSWKFKTVYVVFEAYPESCAFKSQERRSALNAYTPPILKAVKKFRRDIGLAEAFNTKSTDCRIKFGFADCVVDAARFVRYAGEVAEAGDVTGGDIWGDREWLDEEHEDEQDLASVAGMNHFSASLILSQIDLEEFLKMDPQDRLNQFGCFVGADTIMSLNNDIAQRYERLSSVGDSDPPLDIFDDGGSYEQEPAPMYY